jgi:hypothetical protein
VIDASDLFKSLVWDILVEKAIASLLAAVPLLAWGPFGYIITFFAARFADKIYEYMHTSFDLQLIAFKNKALERAYTVEYVRVRAIAESSGIDSQEFKDARAKGKKALSDFVRHDAAR